MARPRFHLLSSGALAWLAGKRWGLAGSAAALCGGLLIDLDHLVDYVWTRLRGQKTHYIAPFHGWELAGALALLAALAARRSIRPDPLPDIMLRPRSRLQALLAHRWVAGTLAGLAAGIWLHLLHDVVSNRPQHAGVYSLLYRLRHGFRREITGWTEHTGFHNWSHLPWYKWF